MEKLNQTFSSIQKKLNDTTWIESQDEDFIEALKNVETMIQGLSAQIFLFVDYFTQYVNIIQSSQLFAGGDDGSDGINSNTNFPPEPANREARRAKAKADKKLLVPEKKLIVP